MHTCMQIYVSTNMHTRTDSVWVEQLRYRLRSVLHRRVNHLQQRVEVLRVFAANAQIAAADMPQHVHLSALSLEPHLVLGAVRDEGVVPQNPLHLVDLLLHKRTPCAAAIVHIHADGAMAWQTGTRAIVGQYLRVDLLYLIEGAK